MPKGLDVGTMNILSAHQTPDEDQTVILQQRNSFVELEYSDIAQKMLERSEVLFIRKGEEVFVVGEDALNFANIFNKETRRPMTDGILSRDEKWAIPMIRMMVERVLQGEDEEAPSGDEHCYFSVPANPVDSDLDTLYHQKTVEAVVNEAGFNAHPINEGMATIYSELADHNFTGLGISCGAGMTNVCLAYYAVPVLQFSVARGGDWIDVQAANATGVPKDRATRVKEKDFELSFETGAGDISGALSVYYDALIEYVTKQLSRRIDAADIEHDDEVPVVLAGGTSSPKGFAKQFEKHLNDADLPFNMGEVAKAEQPMTSVVKGALVAAITEEEEAMPAKA